eukprot:scaffold6986_cov66-Phaeocystis_antarctica.AAC.11
MKPPPAQRRRSEAHLLRRASWRRWRARPRAAAGGAQLRLELADDVEAELAVARALRELVGERLALRLRRAQPLEQPVLVRLEALLRGGQRAPLAPRCLLLLLRRAAELAHLRLRRNQLPRARRQLALERVRLRLLVRELLRVLPRTRRGAAVLELGLHLQPLGGGTRLGQLPAARLQLGAQLGGLPLRRSVAHLTGVQLGRSLRPVRLQGGEGTLVLAREAHELRLHGGTERLEPLLRLVSLRPRRRHQPLPMRARAVLRIGTPSQHRAQRAHPCGELGELCRRRVATLASRLELQPVLQLAHLACERGTLGVRGAQRVRLGAPRHLELLLRLLTRHPRLRGRGERLVSLPLRLAQHALLLALQPLEELLVAARRLPLPLLLLPRRLQLLLE